MEEKENRRISFGRLVFEALPEMWSFHLLATLLMVVPEMILRGLIDTVSTADGTAVTTANLKSFLLSWRMPAFLLLEVILIAMYIIMEVFAQIHLAEDILSGKRSSVIQETRKGALSILRFLTPTGVLTLLYIFIAVPLCGIGFSISLTSAFYIPNFITDVIFSTPLYTVLYVTAILLLAWAGYRFCFILHGVLIDHKTPAEARRASAEIVRRNRWDFLKSMARSFLLVLLIEGVAALLLKVLPLAWLTVEGQNIPQHYHVVLSALDETGRTVLTYRILCGIAVLTGGYLASIVGLLCGAYVMLQFTRCYLRYTGREPEEWPARPKQIRYTGKVIASFAVFFMVLLLSVTAGAAYERIFEGKNDVRIIAHRAGGNSAPENSLEGLEVAIQQGCWGSEIDVQRTADGYYIINHDNSFKRLYGDLHSPQELELEEIRRLKDENGLCPATIEEMLEAVRGKELLFIELKGATADTQMVDDLVKIIREKGMTEEVALISLEYPVIDYTETNYPEFLTGTLFFAGSGDVSKLNCDLLIMEEEAASYQRVDRIHDAGKQAIVWTVNTESGMRRFLSSEIDAVITDELPLAERIREELNDRDELTVMRDRFADAWD